MDLIAICFGQTNRPNTYDQFWKWIPKELPGGDKYDMCWVVSHLLSNLDVP
jgi:hypothetical protein